jgi:hypothetical protein
MIKTKAREAVARIVAKATGGLVGGVIGKHAENAPKAFRSWLNPDPGGSGAFCGPEGSAFAMLTKITAPSAVEVRLSAFGPPS